MTPVPRVKTLEAALKRYNTSLDTVPDWLCDKAASCIDINQPSAETASQTAPGPGTSNVPAGNKPLARQRPPPASGAGTGNPAGTKSQATQEVPIAVAAVIHAAADECIYWSYRESSLTMVETAVANVLGIGALGLGIYGAANKWSTATVTALSASGAGVTIAQQLPKPISVPVQASATAVIRAGLDYYPLMQARARARQIKLNGDAPPAGPNPEVIAELSGLWDAAGTGCSTDVLRGRNVTSPHEAK